MWFELNEDQATFFTVLEQMTGSEDAEFHNADDWGRFELSPTLDSTLEENGFYDAGIEATLGPVAAAAMIYELAKLPVALECAASSLLRPFCVPDLPRPFAVIVGNTENAIRFLPMAKTVLHIRKDGVSTASLLEDDISQVDSLYAYPMGVINSKSLEWTPLDCDIEKITNLWRVAIAAEIIGALKGALESVLSHVRDRQQFGRPLGSFQAVQHRLSTASVQIEGARLLMLRAAQGLDAADSAMALGRAQHIATTIIYDLHQFMGAMGLTLEHPLHRWTYRVRLLRSAFGGAAMNFRSVTEQNWGTA